MMALDNHSIKSGHTLIVREGPFALICFECIIGKCLSLDRSKFEVLNDLSIIRQSFENLSIHQRNIVVSYIMYNCMQCYSNKRYEESWSFNYVVDELLYLVNNHTITLDQSAWDIILESFLSSILMGTNKATTQTKHLLQIVCSLLRNELSNNQSMLWKTDILNKLMSIYDLQFSEISISSTILDILYIWLSNGNSMDENFPKDAIIIYVKRVCLIMSSPGSHCNIQNLRNIYLVLAKASNKVKDFQEFISYHFKSSSYSMVQYLMNGLRVSAESSVNDYTFYLKNLFSLNMELTAEMISCNLFCHLFSFYDNVVDEQGKSLHRLCTVNIMTHLGNIIPAEIYNSVRYTRYMHERLQSRLTDLINQIHLNGKFESSVSSMEAQYIFQIFIFLSRGDKNTKEQIMMMLSDIMQSISTLIYPILTSNDIIIVASFLVKLFSELCRNENHGDAAVLSLAVSFVVSSEFLEKFVEVVFDYIQVLSDPLLEILSASYHCLAVAQRELKIDENMMSVDRQILGDKMVTILQILASTCLNISFDQLSFALDSLTWFRELSLPLKEAYNLKIFRKHFTALIKFTVSTLRHATLSASKSLDISVNAVIHELSILFVCSVSPSSQNNNLYLNIVEQNFTIIFQSIFDESNSEIMSLLLSQREGMALFDGSSNDHLLNDMTIYILHLMDNTSQAYIPNFTRIYSGEILGFLCLLRNPYYWRNDQSTDSIRGDDFLLSFKFYEEKQYDIQSNYYGVLSYLLSTNDCNYQMFTLVFLRKFIKSFSQKQNYQETSTFLKLLFLEEERIVILVVTNIMQLSEHWMEDFDKLQADEKVLFMDWLLCATTGIISRLSPCRNSNISLTMCDLQQMILAFSRLVERYIESLNDLESECPSVDFAIIYVVRMYDHQLKETHVKIFDHIRYHIDSNDEMRLLLTNLLSCYRGIHKLDLRQQVKDSIDLRFGKDFFLKQNLKLFSICFRLAGDHTEVTNLNDPLSFLSSFFDEITKNIDSSLQQQLKVSSNGNEASNPNNMPQTLLSSLASRVVSNDNLITLDCTQRIDYSSSIMKMVVYLATLSFTQIFLTNKAIQSVVRILILKTQEILCSISKVIEIVNIDSPDILCEPFQILARLCWIKTIQFLRQCEKIYDQQVWFRFLGKFMQRATELLKQEIQSCGLSLEEGFNLSDKLKILIFVRLNSSDLPSDHYVKLLLSIDLVNGLVEICDKICGSVTEV